MNCPICNIPLNIADRQGVEIDFCPKCRGVWLDRGELDKIIERSMPETYNRSYGESRHGDRRDRQDDDRRDRHHGDHHHKKRSFLHELFD